MVIFFVPVGRHKETSQCFHFIMFKFDIFLWKYFYIVFKELNASLKGYYFLKSRKCQKAFKHVYFSNIVFVFIFTFISRLFLFFSSTNDI